MTQVFISYAREDWEVAKKIYDDLKQNGARPWMDREDILIGQNWKFAIRQAITQSQYFLALLSTNSVTKRGYVQKELKIALDVLEELPQSDIFILPILIEECEVIEERLKDLHWGELYSSYEDCLNRILWVVQPETPVDEDVVEIRREEIIAVQNPFVETPKQRHSLRKKPIIIEIGKAQEAFKLNKEWKPLKYIKNDFKNNGDGTISDLSTGLIWQQSGSENAMDYHNAESYIQRINKEKFGKYNDWRLPTVDELISLLEPEEKSGDLYIDQIFNNKQWWCWASDISTSGASAWYVGFFDGYVDLNDFKSNFCIRAVRS